MSTNGVVAVVMLGAGLLYHSSACAVPADMNAGRRQLTVPTLMLNFGLNFLNFGRPLLSAVCVCLVY